MLGTPSLTAKSSISSLSKKPRWPAVTREPKLSLRVVVTATAFPSASTTEKWVVLFDSGRRCPADWGTAGRNPSGRWRPALGLAAAGAMVARQAAAYGLEVSSETGMEL